MYVVGNPILNDAKCVIQLAFPPYTTVDYRSFRLMSFPEVQDCVWPAAGCGGHYSQLIEGDANHDVLVDKYSKFGRIVFEFLNQLRCFFYIPKLREGPVTLSVLVHPGTAKELHVLVSTQHHISWIRSAIISFLVLVTVNDLYC